MFFKNRWGRGQPDDIGAINLGDEKFDPDSDKKPRAGQILWIRGLTRLQTQVTIPISHSHAITRSQRSLGFPAPPPSLLRYKKKNKQCRTVSNSVVVVCRKSNTEKRRRERHEARFYRTTCCVVTNIEKSALFSLSLSIDQRIDESPPLCPGSVDLPGVARCAFSVSLFFSTTTCILLPRRLCYNSANVHDNGRFCHHHHQQQRHCYPFFHFYLLIYLFAFFVLQITILQIACAQVDPRVVDFPRFFGQGNQ